MKSKTIGVILGVVFLLMSICRPAAAWHGQGHQLAARLAVAALPDEVPAFFREGIDAISREAIEPDLFRDVSPRELKFAEEPEHFLDLELLQGKPLPPDRYAYYALCTELKINPRHAGTLPYSVTEWTERLTAAFAEHRRWPDDANIKAKCLVYAGILAHYSCDLCQPLHVTIHFNGRVKDGKAPRSEIHNKVDGLPSWLNPADPKVPKPEVHAFEKVLPAVYEEIKRSNALVDRVYLLEADLPDPPPLDQPAAEWKANQKVMDFTRERMQASAGFTASLMLTAWEQSAKIVLPAWATKK